jgi:hypothetical protein
VFLSTPTLEELKQSDLIDLVDMLSRQALEYSQLVKREGISSRSIAVKELIINIQSAIDAKKTSQRSQVTP